MIIFKDTGAKQQNFAVCKHLEKQKDMFMKNSLCRSKCRSKSHSGNSSARGMALVTTLLLLIMLSALAVAFTLAVTANTNTKEEVRMIRNVEVALIPVFQFGVFSDSDLDFFAGPAFTMEGRIQTNGDLYLGAGTPGPTTFTDKLRTAKEVVRDTLANNSPMSTHTGVVQIPTATGGCNGAMTNCRAISYTSPNESSWQNGVWPDTTYPFCNSFAVNLTTTPASACIFT